MVDEVTSKEALQAVNFRTALVSTITTMGLEQLKLLYLQTHFLSFLRFEEQPTQRA